MSVLKKYYYLTKPGIVRGNALAAIAGFFFALQGSFDWQLFASMLAGLSLIVASGCVFNNYFDRHIDARMERTKKRAIPSNRISSRNAIIFGSVLGVAGTALLLLYTTPLALLCALLGWVVYVCFYTPLKHHSSTALYVGAIAGAMPPVVGYTAVTNAFDLYALFLFAALYVWQIPHFIAIAYFRFEEYAAAGIPLVVRRPPSEKAKRIARIVFYTSLVVLLVFCLALILQRWMR